MKVRASVKRICDGCKREKQPKEEEIAALGLTAAEAKEVKFYRGNGCDDCGQSGYRGRQGLYEVMTMTPELRRMILHGASTAELQEQAVKDGMLTLRADGVLKVKKGVTTIEEVVKETSA